MAAIGAEGDVVADFFCGGGTTPVVAQRLNRRWLATNQSRIAVAVTADRITKVVRKQVGNLFPTPDFTVEHWGIYEAPKLEQYDEARFREFVVKAFGGRLEEVSPAIHGVRQGVPLYVGAPSRASRITKDNVARFAKAVYESDGPTSASCSPGTRPRRTQGGRKFWPLGRTSVLTSSA